MISRTLKRSAIASILLGALAAPTTALAVDNAELPDAMDLHKRSIEVSGAAEAEDKFTTRLMKAQFTTPTPGVVATMEIYEASPGKRSVRMSYQGQLIHAATTDGQHVWQVQMGTQPVLVEGIQKAEFLADSRMGMDSDPMDQFESMKTIAKTQFADQPAYEVEVVSKHGTKSTRYYAVDSGLLIGRASPARPDQQAMETRTTLSDFREVDGMTIAFRSELFFPATGTTQVLTVTSIEHNIEIDPAIFTIPEALEQQTRPTDN